MATKKDKHGRTWLLAEWSRGSMWRLQAMALWIEWNTMSDLGDFREKVGENHGWVIEFGWDKTWLIKQPKLPAPCEKCGRQVPKPCRDAEGFHCDGPWDWSCDHFFNPHKYE